MKNYLSLCLFLESSGTFQNLLSVFTAFENLVAEAEANREKEMNEELS